MHRTILWRRCEERFYSQRHLVWEDEEGALAAQLGVSAASMSGAAAQVDRTENRSRRALFRSVARKLRAIFVLVAVLVVQFGLLELQTSWLQSRIFAKWARQSEFTVGRGPAVGFWHPHSGPYDIRLGHSQIGDFIERMKARGYGIESQSQASPAMMGMTHWGIFPVYHEKAQAGLEIVDRRERRLHEVRYPLQVYKSYEEIPKVIVQTLTFIENREALDGRFPYKNPAVEWGRLINATLNLSLRRAGFAREVSGGSTLATQLEKMRHSPGGRTGSAGEKLRQMTTASLRTYAHGVDTAMARQQIITDYLNSIPLAAVPGYGEVNGLGDGLYAWFGADLNEVNRALSHIGEPGEASLDEQAKAYHQVLSLLLAIKKPTAYLAEGHDALAARVEAYMPLLVRAGIVPGRIGDMALAHQPDFRGRVLNHGGRSFAKHKATDGVRAELLESLGVESVYELDRLDLSVESTLDADAQQSVFEFLAHLNNPAFVARAGLLQERLLAEGDPSRVIYSVAVYERGDGANLLRVQADNLDQPLNINEGTKLELGSTAKLRTLATYLGTVVELHGQLALLSAQERLAVPAASDDALTRWAIQYLNSAENPNLDDMLEAAIERRYSASPGAFFTGGGRQEFSNFDASDNECLVSVREAFQRSVNLVFVRLMRDLVYHRMYRLPGVSPALLTDPTHPGRQDYLERYAEREGRQYLTTFYQKYQGLPIDEALRRLASGMRRRTPRTLGVVYRSVRPQDGLDGFAASLIGNLLDPDLAPELIEDLYEEFTPGRFDLADRAYIAGVHPLELWLLEYLAGHPAASLGEVFRASAPHCMEASKWLFRQRQRQAQDRAIRVMLEVDTFQDLHEDWQKLGYPFGWLVPSLGTALGSSGDSPAALTDLLGIIVNDGIHYPAVRVEKLHFAQGTPFETNMARRPDHGRRVMPAEVARVLRRELLGVVDRGTAVRARGVMKLSDGTAVPLGGKTGTGDNRYETYGPDGSVIASRVTNRTAAFVFLIGDRLFGTITAFVPGEQAADYGFTSSLPVQIFRELAPAFAAMLEGRPAPDLTLAVEQRPKPQPVATPEAEIDSDVPAAPEQTTEIASGMRSLL